MTARAPHPYISYATNIIGGKNSHIYLQCAVK
jgi:hypothetical protein